MNKTPSRFDALSLAGMLLGLVTIIGGSALKGSEIDALLSPAAFVIVVLGTLAAILLQTPLPTFVHAMRISVWIFRPPINDLERLINALIGWSQSSRRQGLLSLEPAVDTESDAFVRKGLQLLVDGVEPEIIRNTMEMDLLSREHHDLAAARVFEGMGTYAPTLGIIGAVLGLMSVLQNLAEPARLGHGIAAAFVATIYGIGLANLLFLPLAGKLKAIIARETRARELVMEGLISISLGENPRSIESRLRSFVQ